MSLYFITGIAGAGKSAVASELKAKGYEAYDTDDDGFAQWRNNNTGYIHPKSSVKPEARTEVFLKNHSWIVPIDKINDLAKRAEHKDIFLCGVAYNESEFWHLCKDVFVLTLDDETLKKRLATRTGNDWGKQPQELQHTLELQQKTNKTYQEAGHTIVDATLPIERVVNSILVKTHS
jgi:dephospho-CoA kinase